MDFSIARDDGRLVGHARINRITLQAGSPIQKDFQDSVFFDSPDYPVPNTVLGCLVSKYPVTPTATAVAWIGRHLAPSRSWSARPSPDASPTPRRLRTSR
ncbi:hypothetical protein ACIPWF_10125 [Paenarthrobacter sp. NPDC089989]|uniref:hypothetical protein n=1 Tax=unclassified Paenarthrobacter TaxID=2634190 RepID=UPI00382B914F